MLISRSVTEFDRWVSANNVSETFRFGKGWWDYVEIVRRLGSKLDAAVRVVGQCIIDTPPPEEQLPMPVVALERPGVVVVLSWDFGVACRWPHEWTLSIHRGSPYRGPTLGLFDTSFDLRHERVVRLPRTLVFGPYRDNQAEFSCEVDDEWDVATLLRLVFHEA